MLTKTRRVELLSDVRDLVNQEWSSQKYTLTIKEEYEFVRGEIQPIVDLLTQRIAELVRPPKYERNE